MARGWRRFHGGFLGKICPAVHEVVDTFSNQHQLLRQTGDAKSDGKDLPSLFVCIFLNRHVVEWFRVEVKIHPDAYNLTRFANGPTFQLHRDGGSRPQQLHRCRRKSLPAQGPARMHLLVKSNRGHFEVADGLARHARA